VFDEGFALRLHSNDFVYGNFALRLWCCSGESILTWTETKSKSISILRYEKREDLRSGNLGFEGVQRFQESTLAKVGEFEWRWLSGD
jgi:hypothetical protein